MRNRIYGKQGDNFKCRYPEFGHDILRKNIVKSHRLTGGIQVWMSKIRETFMSCLQNFNYDYYREGGQLTQRIPMKHFSSLVGG